MGVDARHWIDGYGHHMPCLSRISRSRFRRRFSSSWRFSSSSAISSSRFASRALYRVSNTRQWQKTRHTSASLPSSAHSHPPPYPHHRSSRPVQYTNAGPCQTFSKSRRSVRSRVPTHGAWGEAGKARTRASGVAFWVGPLPIGGVHHPMWTPI